MALAVEIATRSNCVKAHVGAIILVDDRVRATGYNGTIYEYDNCFDGGCPRCKDLSKGSGQELDRCVCVHAEENALVSAARYGIPVDEADCYVTHEPCLGCTKLLIQSGLKKVVYLVEYQYPDELDHNASRADMRRHSGEMRRHSEGQAGEEKRGTSFHQFDKSREDAEPLKQRLDDMKERALAYAKTRGVVIGTKASS